MSRIGQILCICILGFIFSCDTDSSFDENNRETQIEGEWKVRSVESNNYSSSMMSPNGETDSSTGSFEGQDINMSLVFNADGTFETNGDYIQVLTVQGTLPSPIIIESRTNDFEGGGTWEVSNDALLIKTSADASFQTARLNVLTDTEMDFDFSYTRLLIEGTVSRTVEVEVNYYLEKS
jgi:hypothetical protein